jgi:hypothetical protein
MVKVESGESKPLKKKKRGKKRKLSGIPLQKNQQLSISLPLSAPVPVTVPIPHQVSLTISEQLSLPVPVSAPLQISVPVISQQSIVPAQIPVSQQLSLSVPTPVLIPAPLSVFKPVTEEKVTYLSPVPAASSTSSLPATAATISTSTASFTVDLTAHHSEEKGSREDMTPDEETLYTELFPDFVKRKGNKWAAMAEKWNTKAGLPNKEGYMIHVRDRHFFSDRYKCGNKTAKRKIEKEEKEAENEAKRVKPPQDSKRMKNGSVLNFLKSPPQ